MLSMLDRAAKMRKKGSSVREDGKPIPGDAYLGWPLLHEKNKAGHWTLGKVAAQKRCNCEGCLEGRSGEEVCVPISSRFPLVIVHPK